MRSDESSRSPAARLWCCPKRTRVNSCGICKRGICQGGGADARVRAGPPGPAAGRYQKASAAAWGASLPPSVQRYPNAEACLELVFVQLLLDGCQQARAILARQFLFHAAKSHAHNVSMVQPGTKLVLRKL